MCIIIYALIISVLLTYRNLFISYRTVEAQVEQHHEEYQSPKHGARHSRYGRRIDDKHQARPLGGYVLDLPAGHMRHVPQDGEYNETGQKAGDRVAHDRQVRIPKHDAQGTYLHIFFLS